MKRPASAKLENRIVTPFTGLIVVAIVAAAAAVFLFGRRDMREKLGREIEHTAKIEAVGVAGTIEKLVFAAGAIAADPQTARTLERRDIDEAGRFIAGEAARLKLRSASLLTPNGSALAAAAMNAAPEEAATPHFLDRVFQTAVETGAPAGGIDVCVPDGLCIQALAPVRAGGRLLGYTRVDLPLNNDYAAEFHKTTGAEMLILRKDRLIASSLPVEKLPLESIDQFAAGLPEKPSQDETPQLTAKVTGRTYMLTASPLRAPGGEVIGWKLIGKSADEIVSEWRRTIGILALVTILVIPLSVAAGIATARRIVRPLKDLLEGVRQLTDGDLKEAVPLSGTQEIDELACSFNEMALALDERQRRLREAADELKSNQEQIIQSGKMAAIGELAAGVAHEIGNPLSAISGYAQMLRRGAATPEQLKTFAGEIEREADFIERIIRDLLDFSRPSAAGFEAIRIEDSIEQALRTISAHPLHERATVEREFADLPPIQGNQKELAQVFLNLFLNALLAMPEGGTLKVTTAARADGAVEIVVSDTGPGVADAVRDKIFDPFFTTRQPGHGTGLGLAISYRIIEKHGGKIESVKNEGGAKFRIVLPGEENG